MKRFIALFALLVISCDQGPGPPPDVTVYAASSLAGAVDALINGWYDDEQFASIGFSVGSSAALRVQIEQGAPADLLLSADTANPQALVDAGLSDGQSKTFATNRLAIIVPDGNPGEISTPLDLARSGVRVIAAGEMVPITQYAEQLVANLTGLPDYPADFASRYEANIVSREDNVGAVVTKIHLGEGDAAIAYITDVPSADVNMVEVPADANVLATYAGVVLKRAANVSAAHAFLDWLLGATGQSILVDAGFSPAP